MNHLITMLMNLTMAPVGRFIRSVGGKAKYLQTIERTQSQLTNKITECLLCQQRALLLPLLVGQKLMLHKEAQQ